MEREGERRKEREGERRKEREGREERNVSEEKGKESFGKCYGVGWVRKGKGLR